MTNVRSRHFLNLTNSPSMVVLGQFASMFLSLTTVPIIARTLGPDGRGVTATIIAVLTIATVALGIGVPLAVRRRVARGDPRRDVMAPARLYAVMMAAPALAVAFPLKWLLFPTLPTAESIAFLVSMACVPLSISWAIDVSVMVATKEFRRLAVLGLLQAGTTFGIICLAWGFQILSVTIVIYSQLAGNFVAFIVGLCWVSSLGGNIRGFTGLVREALSLAGGQLAGITARRLDQVILFPLLGAGGAGIYSVASSVGSLPVPIAQGLGVAAFKELASEHSTDEQIARPRGRRAVRQVLRFSTILAVGTGIALAALAVVFIPIIFGADFAPAIPAAVAAIIGSVFVVIGFNCNMALAAQKRGKEHTSSQVIGAALGLAALFPLALIWGPTGAAIGTAFGSLITMSLSMWHLGLTPLDAIPRRADFMDALRLMVR